MNLTRKMIAGLVLATALVAGIAFLTYYVTSGMFYDFFPQPTHPYITEKASITDVKFDAENPNTLLVDVKWMNNEANGTITFTHAIVKNDLNGKNVLNVDLDNVKLLAYRETTVKVAMENTLPSGKYVVLLVTSRGSSFVSTQFATQ